MHKSRVQNGALITPPSPKNLGPGLCRPVSTFVFEAGAGPQPGLARDHPPPPAADPSQKWRGTASRPLSGEGPHCPCLQSGICLA